MLSQSRYCGKALNGKCIWIEKILDQIMNNHLTAKTKHIYYLLTYNYNEVLCFINDDLCHLLSLEIIFIFENIE